MRFAIFGGFWAGRLACHLRYLSRLVMSDHRYQYMHWVPDDAQQPPRSYFGLTCTETMYTFVAPKFIEKKYTNTKSPEEPRYCYHPYDRTKACQHIHPFPQRAIAMEPALCIFVTRLEGCDEDGVRIAFPIFQGECDESSVGDVAYPGTARVFEVHPAAVFILLGHD